MRYQDYEHEKYESTAKLEWLILGRCPIGDRQESDSSEFAPCGKWNTDRWQCSFLPGGTGWDTGARCSPLWIKRYNIPKRKEKGDNDA